MRDYLEEYDETDPISIETYAKRLIGQTFADVCKQDDIIKARVVRETINYEARHENMKRKGGLGELIEERFFHYQTNNDARPDFDKAGVELKVTPYKQNKNGTLVAKERLILTMIDYFAVVDEAFEDSHMWQKAQLILLVYYLYQQEIFMYCDPPYMPETESSQKHILYTQNGFEHERFIEYMDEKCSKEDISVMISMAETKNVEQLYKEHVNFNKVKIEEIVRKVNPTKKMKSKEVAFVNYEVDENSMITP